MSVLQQLHAEKIAKIALFEGKVLIENQSKHVFLDKESLEKLIDELTELKDKMI